MVACLHDRGLLPLPSMSTGPKDSDVQKSPETTEVQVDEDSAVEKKDHMRDITV